MKYWITNKINLKTIEAPEEHDLAVLVHTDEPKVFVYEDDRWWRVIEEIEDPILEELAEQDRIWNERFPSNNPDKKYYYSLQAESRQRHLEEMKN